MTKLGTCKLCSHQHATALNNAIALGKGYTVVSREMEPLGLQFSKGTFLAHKAHVTSPVVTALEHGRANPVIVPTSNRAVLEMIRDYGMQKAMENPEEVTVKDALKAAQILQQGEGKQESVLVILAKAIMKPQEEEYLLDAKEV